MERHGFFSLVMDYTVTALKVQKHNSQRVNVYLDGEFAFGLARIVAAWLSVGQKISDEKIALLKADDGREVAYQQALRLLSYRARSQAELQQNLRKRGTPEDVIEGVIQRLSQAGLMNDQQFAQNWIDNRSEFRPRSRRALGYELKQRGVDPETIETTLSGVDDQALAYEAAQKKARRYQDLDRQAFRQKMIAFLGRRGFSYEVIAPVVARVWAETHPEEELIP
jgi:regulatory protein